MSLLLDTHAFLWWVARKDDLSVSARQACESTGAALMLSVASVWEIQIKVALGKLKLAPPLKDLIQEQQANGLEVLTVKLPHVWKLGELPRLHGDPFDRLLAAQALAEGLTLVTRDKMFASYGVRTLW